MYESDTADYAETATHEDRFREQMQISERLNEYYNQVVAEIRAALEQVEEEAR